MKYILIFAILLASLHCKAQMDSAWSLVPKNNDSTYIGGYGLVDSGWSAAKGNWELNRDTCRWEQRIDTIHVEFIITVESLGFLRKKDVGVIIHKYEEEVCSNSWYYHHPNRNDVYLVDGEPIEILFWKRKGTIYMPY